MFDFSSRGQLCLIQADKMSACTTNLLVQNLSFEDIEQDAVSDSIANADPYYDGSDEYYRATKYTIE